MPAGSAPEDVFIVDMGRLQTSVVVARFGTAGEGEEAHGAEAKCPYTVLAVRSDEDLGAFNFDQRMFVHFQGTVSRLFFVLCFACISRWTRFDLLLCVSTI